MTAVKEVLTKSVLQQPEHAVPSNGVHNENDDEDSSNMINLPLNDNTITSSPSTSIDEEVVATDINDQESDLHKLSSNIGGSNDYASALLLNPENGNTYIQQQRGSKYSKHQRYQLYGLIMAGIMIIFSSFLIGGLTISSATEWKSVDDGTAVSAGEVVVQHYDYCGESDLKPLDPGDFGRCKQLYVCSFQFLYVILVGNMLYGGDSTIKTDYQEEYCYYEMLNQRTVLLGMREPFTIYYNPDDPNENDYHKVVNAKQAGEFFMIIGVVVGVLMTVIGAVMLKFDKCHSRKS
uniref:Uncharacterized protein n=1 Tax=Leptocylindrus danicus TaxID=163516 RepID=A0A7S2KIV1_9STRA|mmetsp:Transcript_23291/g.34977  ORF Transcript_23291/g.34977 Transcript_23291/m.34977 type:complete len:292 (+) Transcript_23291:130-1005(+)|eukprot:CAMPEP_0116021508 /NCGR_PEP_ID=MMETSP0321-20121206/10430_1 /TAXON_ID=163516 /ORGANISM="Leptocylindrus danicus var. danicus, Strain B650" /LENGTH=291 /DNA_ID=CAMNT_0003492395 /DNA_START=48 /DNA_END=923 /DNA_ORIENTATION=+